MAIATSEITQPDPLRVQQAMDDNGERRLTMKVSTRADLAMERLARRYAISKRDVIERLVLATDECVVAGLDMDSIEWDTYFATHAGREG